MNFKNFTIKNFKGIEDTSLNLNIVNSANIYTLLGLNESGKTTILEALNYWSYSQDSKETIECLGFQTIQDDYELIPISEAANFNKQSSVAAVLTLNKEDKEKIKTYAKKECKIILTKDIDEIKITKSKKFENSQVVETTNYWDINIVGRKIQSRAKKDKFFDAKDSEWQKIIAFIRDNLLPTILYFPNFLFDFPERIYLEGKIENTKKAKIHNFYKSTIQDILDSLDMGLDIQKHIIERANSNNSDDKKSLDTVLIKMEQELNKHILGSWNEIFKRKIDNKKIKISCEIDATDGTYLEFQIEEDGIFSINQRSLGFRWFFAFLLFTKYRGKSKIINNILFLLDEPASNLHTTAQIRLQKCLEEMAKNERKFIYTTHSQYLVNPKWLEATFIVKNAGLSYDDDDNIDDFSAQKTKITAYPYRQFVSEYPDQTSYFKPVLDFLDYIPSKLDMTKNVVMLEGKNDFYTLNYFNDIILKTRKNYNFLPGLSCQKLFPIIQHYIAWGKKFVILLDSDKAGTESKDEYIEAFGAILNNKIYTLEDIDSSFKKKKLEDLIDKKERITIQQTYAKTQNKYNKKLFNRVLQEYYVSNKAFTFSDETIANFKKIENFIKSKIK